MDLIHILVREFQIIVQVFSFPSHNPKWHASKSEALMIFCKGLLKSSWWWGWPAMFFLELDHQHHRNTHNISTRSDNNLVCASGHIFKPKSAATFIFPAQIAFHSLWNRNDPAFMLNSLFLRFVLRCFLAVAPVFSRCPLAPRIEARIGTEGGVYISCLTQKRENNSHTGWVPGLDRKALPFIPNIIFVPRVANCFVRLYLVRIYEEHLEPNWWWRVSWNKEKYNHYRQIPTQCSLQVTATPSSIIPDLRPRVKRSRRKGLRTRIIHPHHD